MSQLIHVYKYRKPDALEDGGVQRLAIDPATVTRIKEDVSDETCLLTFTDGEELWIHAKYQEIVHQINANR